MVNHCTLGENTPERAKTDIFEIYLGIVGRCFVKMFDSLVEKLWEGFGKGLEDFWNSDVDCKLLEMLVLEA